jgi:small subunit ribosomal protein S6
MVRYETLFLANPEVTADEAAAIERDFEKIIQKGQGSTRSFERWGKYRLAYPVQKNEYGVYFLSRFELDQQYADGAMEEIRTLFTVRYPQLVMRYMNTRLDIEQPLQYIRPDSLEDMPAQDVETFLRENKMEGLLKSSGDSGKHAKSDAIDIDEEGEMEDEE